MSIPSEDRETNGLPTASGIRAIIWKHRFSDCFEQLTRVQKANITSLQDPHRKELYFDYLEAQCLNNMLQITTIIRDIGAKTLLRMNQVMYCEMIRLWNSNRLLFKKIDPFGKYERILTHNTEAHSFVWCPHAFLGKVRGVIGVDLVRSMIRRMLKEDPLPPNVFGDSPTADYVPNPTEEQSENLSYNSINDELDGIQFHHIPGRVEWFQRLADQIISTGFKFKKRRHLGQMTGILCVDAAHAELTALSELDMAKLISLDRWCSKGSFAIKLVRQLGIQYPGNLTRHALDVIKHLKETYSKRFPALFSDDEHPIIEVITVEEGGGWGPGGDMLFHQFTIEQQQRVTGDLLHSATVSANKQQAKLSRIALREADVDLNNVRRERLAEFIRVESNDGDVVNETDDYEEVEESDVEEEDEGDEIINIDSDDDEEMVNHYVTPRRTVTNPLHQDGLSEQELTNERRANIEASLREAEEEDEEERQNGIITAWL